MGTWVDHISNTTSDDINTSIARDIILTFNDSSAPRLGVLFNSLRLRRAPHPQLVVDLFLAALSLSISLRTSEFPSFS